MKPFIDEISEALDINRVDLVEKDVILHNLLREISEDSMLRRNLIFKGGTCLIKCYLGYYRFSEDLDFTWRDQKTFLNKSGKEIRRYLSDVIDEIGDRFERICEKAGLEFICDKGDKRWVEIGGSNKMVTFKFWYESELLKTTSFIKVQINFVEDIIYPSINKDAVNLIEDRGTLNIESIFPEDYEKYTTEIVLPSYDIREILCEKVRSILLRRGVKARDFVDIHKICSEGDIEIFQYTEDIVRKTNFSLELYKKYRENLDDKRPMLSNKDLFSWGDEREFVLTDIDEKDLYESIDKINTLLIDVVNRL